MEIVVIFQKYLKIQQDGRLMHKISVKKVESLLSKNLRPKHNQISLRLTDELCKAIDNARLKDPYPLPRTQWIITLLEFYLKG